MTANLFTKVNFNVNRTTIIKPTITSNSND